MVSRASVITATAPPSLLAQCILVTAAMVVMVMKVMMVWAVPGLPAVLPLQLLALAVTTGGH